MGCLSAERRIPEILVRYDLCTVGADATDRNLQVGGIRGLAEDRYALSPSARDGITQMMLLPVSVRAVIATNRTVVPREPEGCDVAV